MAVKGTFFRSSVSVDRVKQIVPFLAFHTGFKLTKRNQSDIATWAYMTGNQEQSALTTENPPTDGPDQTAYAAFSKHAQLLQDVFKDSLTFEAILTNRGRPLTAGQAANLLRPLRTESQIREADLLEDRVPDTFQQAEIEGLENSAGDLQRLIDFLGQRGNDRLDEVLQDVTSSELKRSVQTTVGILESQLTLYADKSYQQKACDLAKQAAESASRQVVVEFRDLDSPITPDQAADLAHTFMSKRSALLGQLAQLLKSAKP